MEKLTPELVFELPFGTGRCTLQGHPLPPN